MEVDANPRHGAGQRDNREQQQRVADRLRPSSDRFLPAITDVLSATAISFTNDANSGRFQILKRWNDTILGNVGTAGQQTDKSSIVVDEFLSLPFLALRLQGCWHRRDRRHRTRRPLPDHGGRQRGWQYRLDAILAFRTRFLDV